MSTEAKKIPDYREAAMANLFFAKMERLYGRRKSSEAHYALADMYIKGELKKETGAYRAHTPNVRNA